MIGQVCRRLGAVSLLLLAGCGRGPEKPAGTGAKETAERYYTAIIQSDWPAAYDLLDPQSRSRVSADRYARLAQDYRRGLGFEPKSVRITACQERSTEAIAHVTLTGSGHNRRRFKDGITLRRTGDRWSIVLAANFGRAARS